MGTGIRTRIIRIGNSQGIRIPKPLLEQSGIDTEVEIEVQDECLIVRAASRSRIGWDKAFAAMAEQKDDVLLDDVNITEWDRTEWKW
ncbi:AbrB/MazE/SpoVT family DNA-binding domain-containing protein [Chroococcidiopsis sp. CCALA 051]|jgi:antitoxin MazE|uniref:AbrB/MazE/SpoVT family DNA-binding domain-containing protein n=1 Tax=Chroococcidiopsis sp. CCALA 051 TaxID=869949 RepID=UPI000D0CBEEF|nr:AbrB/MazE/SpoVT family DNA-binding domain-containing protein [Chroococcidiopsis sp. CCALA 051]MBE9015712.1 AbrB/MazE/SpoVT family DNA-binding domain-containing protein [Chroococcidiopsidales cyanobacterium LEGE 13417]PSM47941.1 AbrB/MazE/SpoVT family DNA-binding domain-containing protein [Chroococcidiopsis sp. CCALA 051]